MHAAVAALGYWKKRPEEYLIVLQLLLDHGADPGDGPRDGPRGLGEVARAPSGERVLSGVVSGEVSRARL